MPSNKTRKQNYDSDSGVEYESDLIGETIQNTDNESEILEDVEREDVVTRVTLTNMSELCRSHEFVVLYSQRPYSWGFDQIDKFMDDVVNTHSTNKKFSLGSIHLLKNANAPTKGRKTESYTVWDGQQRLVTHFLTLVSIVNYIDEHYQDDLRSATNSMSILRKTVLNTIQSSDRLGPKLFSGLVSLSRNDKSVASALYDKIDEDLKYKPRITYNKVSSDRAIHHIGAKTYRPSLVYFKDIEDADQNVYSYRCNLCGAKLKEVTTDPGSNKVRELVYMCREHISSCNKSDEIDLHDLYQGDERLCENLDYIYASFVLRLPEYANNCDMNGREFLEYFVDILTKNNNITCMYDADSDSAGIVFEYENNRGVECTPYDLVKNKVLASLRTNVDLKLFCENTSFDNNDKDQYSYLNVAISTVESRYFEPLDDVFSRDNSEKYSKRWEMVCSKAKDIFTRYPIFELIKTSNPVLAIYVVLTVAIDREKILNDVINMIASYTFLEKYSKLTKRSNTFSDSNFDPHKTNPLKEQIVDLINKITDRKTPDSTIRRKLSKILVTDLKHNKNYTTDFIDGISRAEVNKGTNRKLFTHILLMYNSWLSNQTTVHVQDASVEHIVARNKKKTTNIESIEKIGNLTIIPQTNNRITKTKGNSSLRDRDYDQKKIVYEKSALMINIELVRHYDEFCSDEHINDRTNKLVKKIARILNAYVEDSFDENVPDEFKGCYSDKVENSDDTDDEIVEVDDNPEWENDGSDNDEYEYDDHSSGVVAEKTKNTKKSKNRSTVVKSDKMMLVKRSESKKPSVTQNKLK
ncbi:DUF262 domain-containing protein [Yasminevirus sp. GU-2018]|uniref:DUF262 domain-containing protein n=1 Tax=Yasminevirus sp. GU-2018 TaxID=2420051 RepID=A0A5K0U9T2_9VIRU|nr:DUF262 domain-containing protein [Yasminevirus sp. GU-2018]